METELELRRFEAAKSRWIFDRYEMDPLLGVSNLEVICSMCDGALGRFFRESGWPSNGAISNYGRVFGFDQIIGVSEKYGMPEQGFLAFADGADGDFIVVNLVSHVVGWLPFGDVFPDVDIMGVFVPIGDSIGTLFWRGEFDWLNVAKDYTSAKKIKG